MSNTCLLLDEDLILETLVDLDITEYSDAEILNVVKKLKSQTNEGKSPITTETLELLKNTLIECAEDDEIKIDINSLNEKLTRYWNETDSSRSNSVNDKLVNLEDTEIPNLSNGLFYIFKNSTDRKNFIRWANSNIVRAIVENPTTGQEVSTDVNLNTSLLEVQNILAEELAKYLEIPVDKIYKNNKFNQDYYNRVVTAARLRFYGNIENGKYVFSTKRDLNNFNKYLLLTNFDRFIDTFSHDVVSIKPSLFNNRELFASGLKYSTAKLHVAQNWNDEESGKASINTSKVVQMYITSLEEINKDGQLTGNTVQFRDFNSLIRIIKEHSSLAKSDIREKPSEAIKEIMDEMYINPSKFFTGEDTLLLNTFYTIYNNAFKSNGNSLHDKNTANNSSTKNNLYSMICSHLSKMTSVAYKQTSWDEEDNKYVVNFLDSENISIGKNNLEKHLTLNAILGNYEEVVNDYSVQFLMEGDRISGVSFIIGSDKYTIDFKDSKVPNNAKSVIKKFSGKEYVEFFNKILKLNFDSSFYEGLLVANSSSPSNVYKLLNLAANVLVSNKLGAGLTNPISKLVPGVLDSKQSKSWFNRDLASLRVGGFNNALSALEALAKGQSFLNKDISRSNVKNSEGASLGKYRLTCLSESDLYLFKELRDQVYENSKHPLRHNLLVGQVYSMLSNFFKTEFVNYKQESRQVKAMTTQELLYDQFVSGYLSDRNKSIDIQPAVYADKSVIQGKQLDVTRKFSYTDIDGNIIVDNKSFSELTNKELEDLFFTSMKGQFSLFKKQLTADYDLLFSTLHTLYPKRFSAKDSYEEYETEISKLTKRDIYEAVRAIHLQGNTNFEIIPEIHFTYNKKAKKYQFNNVLRMYFAQYLNDDRKNFKHKNTLEIQNYAETLRASEVRFDTVLANGLINKAVVDHLPMEEDQTAYLSERFPRNVVSKITGKGSKYKDIWIDNDIKALRNYILVDENGNIVDDPTISLINTKLTVVINPELLRYKLFDNIISNNYNLATVGLSFLHPTKKFAQVKDWSNISNEEWTSLKEEESSRTTALNKRGVVYGATGHPFLKNKKDGIAQYLNIAVIEDLEAKNMGLSGDNEDATQFDGAIFINGLWSIWERNSLPELALSSVHKKPLGYSSMGLHLGSKLLKCATFALNNAAVRNSITSKVNIETLLHNMMGNAWLVPDLDISPYFNPIYYSDPNNLGHYYQMINLSKTNTVNRGGKVDNIYHGTIVEVDERGKIIGEPVKKEFHLNNNYDIWKAFGGGYSCSLVNGKLIESEESLELLAEIGNNVNVEADENIPEKYIKVEGGKRYFQPIKQSDVHYLSNASGIKNGMSNVNMGELYYDSVSERIEPSDQLIFGHPAFGKTIASKMGYDFISFDDYNKSKIDNFIKSHKNPEETKYDYKKRRDPEYQNFLLELLKENLQEGKQVFFSDLSLLDAINNTDDIVIDKIFTMSSDNFVERSIKRGSKEEDIPTLLEWKANLDAALNQYIESDGEVKVIDATNHNLYEYFGGNLITSEFDPKYLIIQLNAEHDIEDDVVSEMTQVISSMEQGSFTHDLANQILSDIGKSISEKLDLYRKFNVTTEEGRKELNRILGKALVRVFANKEGQEISLASAYLENIREELSSDNVKSIDIADIPFDDNNLLGAFETNFKNGFNKDIIKRKFSGFAAVLNPSQDMYHVYEYNGRAITTADFKKLAPAEQVTTMKDFLSKLDKEVPASKIMTGDWIEFNGVPTLVGTLNTAGEGEISLSEIRNLRGTNIKLLGSRGRNLRAQNYLFTVNPDAINNPDNKFDQYDFDSVLLSHKLKDFIKEYNTRNPDEYLLQVFNEVSEYIKSIYPDIDIVKYINDYDKLKKYVKLAIQKDMNDLQSGIFNIPIKYRNKKTIKTTEVFTSEYTPNELAVGKPWATKFLLEEGDNLADVSIGFFKNKLAKRRSSPVDKEFYNFYFTGNNYNLHFSYDKDIVKKLRKAKYSVTETNLNGEVITTPEGKIRQVNSEISYPISDNMKFYTITTPEGKTIELVLNFTDSDIKNIWNSENFYTNSFNFSNFKESYTGDKLDKNFKRLRHMVKLYSSLNNVNPKYSNYDDLYKFVNSINPEANDLKLATKMYTSFKEATKVIAARIPAQSMQSFMNMKIVGFLETDTNVAYVPVVMLIYEGSDFKLKFIPFRHTYA